MSIGPRTQAMQVLHLPSLRSFGRIIHYNANEGYQPDEGTQSSFRRLPENNRKGEHHYAILPFY